MLYLGIRQLFISKKTKSYCDKVATQTRRDFLKKTEKLAKLAIVGGAGYEILKHLSIRKQQTEFGPAVDDLHLNKKQLEYYLGIVPERPILEFTREAWGGWAGPGMYVFRRVNITTPYLKREQQLNDWNYVLYRERRVEPSTGVICGVDPAIKYAVNRRYSSIIRR